MVKGIGYDLCSISRMEKAAQRQGFLERVFTPGEIAYCRGRGRQMYASLAARFAAKEAALKSLGTGLRQGTLQDVEVLNDVLGKPELFLYGVFAAWAAQKEVAKIYVSLTHEKDYAGAMVVLEG